YGGTTRAVDGPPKYLHVALAAALMSKACPAGRRGKKTPRAWRGAGIVVVLIVVGSAASTPGRQLGHEAVQLAAGQRALGLGVGVEGGELYLLAQPTPNRSAIAGLVGAHRQVGGVHLRYTAVVLQFLRTHRLGSHHHRDAGRMAQGIQRAGQ